MKRRGFLRNLFAGAVAAPIIAKEIIKEDPRLAQPFEIDDLGRKVVPKGEGLEGIGASMCASPEDSVLQLYGYKIDCMGVAIIPDKL